MIKKYLEFIGESNIDDINDKYHSVGEYIESNFGEDDYVLNLVGQHTKEIDPTIKLSNAINLLTKEKQQFILDSIDSYRNGGDSKEPEVITYTDVNLSEATEITQGGKFLFKCFLKVLTALGQKEIKPNWEKTPDEYLIYFKSTELDVEFVKSIMIRYTQFNNFINSIDYTHNQCQLYFGIKVDMTFSYGLATEEQIIPIGQFKITKGSFNWMVTLDSPSAHNLKKEMIALDFNGMVLCGKIKVEMKKFSPGESQHKTNPVINGDIITFSYYGVGKWSNGQMDVNDLTSIKNSFMNFLSKYKWSEKIQVSITSNQFWLYLNIKLK